MTDNSYNYDDALQDTIQKIKDAEVNNEATAYPIWFIFNPSQMMKPDCYYLSSMIDGPFFSRASASEYLKNHRYNYGKHAVVFCASGVHSRDWTRFYDACINSKEQPNG